MLGDKDFFEEETDSKTAFNSSLDIIQRISRFEYSLAAAFLAENLLNAFKILRLIYAEIDFKLKEDQIEEIDSFIEKLKLTKEEALKIYKVEGRTYLKNPNLKENFMEDLYELKRVLGRLKYKVGLGMSDMSDPRYALLNG